MGFIQLVNVTFMVLIIFISGNVCFMDDKDMPQYLKDKINNFMKENKKSTVKESVITMNSSEFLADSYYLKNRTTHYIDRYPTTDMDLELSSHEINFFTKQPNDTEEVYTGPTMDPSDLYAKFDTDSDWQSYEPSRERLNLKCRKCNKTFKTERGYYNHLYKIENMTTPLWFLTTVTRSYRYVKKTVTCPDGLCKEPCKDYGVLMLHLIEVHNGLPENWGLNSSEYVKPSIKLEELKLELQEQGITLSKQMKASLRRYKKNNISVRRNITRNRKTTTQRIMISEVDDNIMKLIGEQVPTLLEEVMNN